MGLWNIHGINSWKLEHFDFISFIYNHSIVFLTETWKRSNNTNLLYNNDDFIEFHVCRQVVKTAKRNSGGITVLIKKEIEMYIEHVKSYRERELSGLNYQKKILAHNMIFIYVVHISHQ